MDGSVVPIVKIIRKNKLTAPDEGCVVFGMLLPDQIALAQQIFKDILKQPWFVRSRENDRDCAVMIVRAIQADPDANAELAHQMKITARQRFSDDSPSGTP